MKVLTIQTMVIMTDQEYERWKTHTDLSKEILKELGEKGSVRIKRTNNSSTTYQLQES